MKVLIIDDNQMVLELLNFKLKNTYELFLAPNLQKARLLMFENPILDLVIIDLNLGEESGLSFIQEMKANQQYAQIPVLVLSGEEKSEIRIACLELGADDFVLKPFHPDELKLRIKKILSVKRSHQNDFAKPLASTPNLLKPEISFRKRAFDVVFSFLAILILLPIFVIVAIFIKIDSKGPFLYLSKRVGAGYKVFDLYKFRTMKINADKDILAMNAANMYNKPTEIVEESGIQELIYDGGWISEEVLKSKKDSNAAFMKFHNDPRITRLGSFLRNSSLDELPQLFNILKGDMSIVGNRPLPLYEAEKLTKDESAARFLAPAGLTGLWQVTKRGRAKLSEKERMQLDNTYAFKHNWLVDIKLIFKTFLAMFQSEKM